MANTTYNIDVKVQSKSLGDLENELQQINQELKQVEIGSDSFKQLSQQAQKATKELKVAEEAVEGFTDEKKFMAADGAIKVLGGSLASVVGVLGTLGVESEIFGEFEKKAASAIALAIGLKDISEGFRQIKDSSVLAGIATKLFGEVTKKALISTGIGLFVVALGTIVAYWDDIKASLQSNTAAQKRYNDRLQETKTLSESTVSLLESQISLIDAKEGSTLKANLALQKELQLQIAITDELIAQKKLELTNEEEENRQLTFWEKLRTGVYQATGAFGAAATSLAEGYNPASERTKELGEEINNLLINRNSLETKLIGINQTVATQTEMAAGNQEKLVTSTVGMADATTKYSDSLQITSGQITDTVAAQLMKTAADNENAVSVKNANDLENARRQTLYSSGEALQAIGSILNQESAAAKALAIGSAIINTYLGVTEVLKQPSTLPSPFDVITKVANVATILASGFKAVQSIKSTPLNGGGSMDRSTPTVNGPRMVNMNQQPLAPQVINTAPTVKAYVLSGDVTSSQEADAKLSRKRTLG